MSGNETPLPTDQADEEGSRTWKGEVHATRMTVVRGKLVAVFLMLNWALMGWFTTRAPSNWFAAMTLLLGLICLLMGLTMWRGAKRAETMPMVRWDDEVFSFRSYTRDTWLEFPWRRLRHANPKRKRRDRPTGDHVEVTVENRRVLFLGFETDADPGEKRDDSITPRPVLGLADFAPTDREKIHQLLQRRILKRA